VRFLADASLPRSATALLRDLGHEAVDVRDIGMGGATDDVVAEHARLGQRALVTRDHANAGQVTRALETFARTNGWLGLLTGRLAIVEPSRVHFRPAP
jgi:hypothetical protein